MRAPNAQGCALVPDDKVRSIALVGEIMMRCVEYFEVAVVGGYAVEFRVVSDDCGALARLYPGEADTAARLRTLVNDALVARNLPYRLGDLVEHYALSFLYQVHFPAKVA